MKTLKETIDHLYAVFESYKVKEGFRERCCPCCITDEEIKTLLSKPLREMSEDDFGRYIGKAMTTWGDETDYKYFLPRILELLNDSKKDLFSDFKTFEKLNYTSWRKWNESEQGAIQEYFFTLWDNLISSDVVRWDVMSLLEVIVFYFGTDKLTEIWIDHLGASSIQLVAEIVLSQKLLDIEKEQYLQLLKRFYHPKVLDELEKAYFKLDDELEAYQYSLAYTELEKMMKENTYAK